ncbi:YchJ family metal-binding protein [Streptomyces sp. SL13]|uniref:UPF0225 protein POF50_007665 n=1 Tax=Streptantibioticus silvisoli TaxID=2705255 RepID=A0AA90K898_9ACTN|nr:YchJ family metal-binding protein [Streptantibioticus silvisoli]MDI5969222.1 YchJ family metal-binding protein [Streptantibioticus silvisoli]
MAHRSSRRPTASAPAACPCGLPAEYADCCGRLHRGSAHATSPQELMRSRYSAFVVGDTAYLLRTWHPSTRPPALELDTGLRWQRLEIVATEGGGPFHSEGVVEFRAHYRQAGRNGAMCERSRFSHLDGAWVYVDGDVTVTD